MSGKTGNHGYLRHQNLSGVLQHIYEKAPVSRIETSRATGLNKATISSIVGDLIENRFVREIGIGNDKRAGRREVLLDIDPARGCIISAEIGVGFISAICTDFKAKVIWHQREAIDTLEPGAVLSKAIEILKSAQAKGETEIGPLQGVAVGIPGLIDHKTGRLLLAPNLGWRDVDILSVLEATFEVPVFTDNEATFAALGERYFGVARGFSDVLYISAGVGIGGGLIVDGQIFNGAGGFASEFGHMTMEPDGLECGCGGIGCWETVAGQAALFRNIKKAVQSSGDPVFSAESLDELTVRAVVGAAERGSRLVLAELDSTAHKLAIGIDSLIKVFDPELVVFGGRLSLAGRFLVPVIEADLDQRSMLGPAGRPRVVIAEFGSEAAAMGGAARIFQSILNDPKVES